MQQPVRPLGFSGTILNLLGHDISLPPAVEGWQSVYPPDPNAAVPYVSWAESDTSAGLQLACRTLGERPITLLPGPGFSEIGKFNLTIPLICPNNAQREFLTQHWRKAVKFQHALIHDQPSLTALRKRAHYQHLIVAASGPGTAEAYKPNPELPSAMADIYVVMSSSAALVMHYTILEELDYVLVPGVFPREDGQVRPTAEVDAFIPAKILIDPNARFRQQEKKPHPKSVRDAI